jgi:hypothetical protein
MTQERFDLRRVEAKPRLGAWSEANSRQLVGMFVDEVPADAEPPRDLARIDKIATRPLGTQQLGYPNGYCLYVRFAERHCPLWLLSIERAKRIGTSVQRLVFESRRSP